STWAVTVEPVTGTEEKSPVPGASFTPGIAFGVMVISRPRGPAVAVTVSTLGALRAAEASWVATAAMAILLGASRLAEEPRKAVAVIVLGADSAAEPLRARVPRAVIVLGADSAAVANRVTVAVAVSAEGALRAAAALKVIFGRVTTNTRPWRRYHQGRGRDLGRMTG